MSGKIPKDKYININTVESDIDKCVDDYLTMLCIERDYKSLTSIKHQTVNGLFRYIYKQLFKPDRTLCNNQKSYVDYNNTDLLQVLADKFIDICSMFNKSLGIMAFGYMIGADVTTLMRWGSDEKSNPERYKVVKYIRESHKAAQISLLNDSPVGALAVANNDVETGLQWSLNQTITAANNAVFLIPSERLNRLNIGNSEPLQLANPDQQEKPARIKADV